MPGLTIGRAARSAGVNVETIRFYERRGLIKQPRKPANGGFREYDLGTLAHIRFVRQAQELGFSLSEVRELLSLRADPFADCAEVRQRASAKLADVRGKIERLQRIGAALETLIAACPGGGALKACSILEAMEPEPEGRGPEAGAVPAASNRKRHQRAP
jgi:MerR family copper efflux transcriptional regulator